MATKRVKVTLELDTEELRAMRYFLGRRYGEGRFRDQLLSAAREVTGDEATAGRLPVGGDKEARDGH